MQVRLLGHVEVVPDDDKAPPLPLSGPTQRRVLASLALRLNEVVSVSRLTEVVWPSGDLPPRADHNLRTYVHRLRSAMDGCGDRVETAGAGYRLRLHPSELDIAEFDRLLGAASRLVDMGEAAAALDVIDTAEGLWRGDPLSEFADETWAIPHVVRLQHLRSELRALKASALIESGRAGSAVALLEELIHEQPLQERPRALLMQALHETGRQAEALRAFQDFRRRLIDETGIEPSDDLANLEQSILMNELSRRDPLPKIAGYRLDERIGAGEYTTVYRATQEVLDRPVAIKIIRAELANRPQFIRQFEIAAQRIARIEHPHAVRLYDYWREPDQAFLVMQWMAGGSLVRHLDRAEWTVEAIVDLIDRIAEALDAAHRIGVVHGDVRADNIMFDSDDRPYLGDFGLARLGALGTGAPDVPVDAILGTDADIGGLAGVAFGLLTGRVAASTGWPSPPLTQLRPELSKAVEGVLRAAISPTSTDRYPTAAAMAAEFRATCLTGLPGSTAPPETRSNPYKGLSSFDETDSAAFHGREGLVDELIERLQRAQRPVLAVVGPSGSGKSSVVCAGLLTALQQGRIPGSDGWFVTTMTPGAHPFEALAAALLKVAIDPPASLLEHLSDGERGMARVIDRILPGGASALIVIDQFEELFNGGVAEDETERFLSALVATVEESAAPARLVLTLRADFYDRPLRHPGFAPLLKEGTVVVTPLAADELERAIVEPAAAVGVRFEPGLVSEIVAEVSHEPGALPLLQYALTKAFDVADGDTITRDAYQRIGGLTGAVAQEAEAMWRSADDARREAIRHLFGRLVTLGEGTGDTRRRVRLAELDDEPPTRAAIELFAEARLLTFDRDPATRQPTVEMAHEAIIRQWPRLRRWLDDDRHVLRLRRHLTAAADGWLERDRDPDELYRGPRLEAAEVLLGSNTVTLNATETEFLQSSLARRDADRRTEQNRVRRLRRVTAGIITLALVATLAGVGAIVQGQKAEAASRDSETGRIVATAQSLASSKPRAALLLAAIAYSREESPRTLGALHTALSQTGPELQYLGWGADYIDVEWADTESVVGIRSNGVDLFDLASGQLVDSIAMDIGTGVDSPGAVTRELDRASSRGSIGGGVLAVTGSGTEVAAFAVDGRLQELFRATMPDRPTGVSVSPDGGHIVAAAADGTVAAWGTDGMQVFPPFRLDLAPHLTEQFSTATDYRLLMSDWFDVDPLWVRPIAHYDHFHLAAGSQLHTLGYDGIEMGDSVTTYFGPGPSLPESDEPAASVPQQVMHVIHDGSATLLVGTSSVGYDTGEGAVQLVEAEATFGSAGLWMSSVFATRAGALIGVREDGSVVELDPGTGETTDLFGLRVDPVRAGAANSSVDRVALATAEGLVIAALDGGGPLHTTLPRDDGQVNVSVSEDGRFVVLGPNGLGSEISIFELDDGRHRPVPILVAGTTMSLRPPHYLWISRLDGLQLTEYIAELYRLDGTAPELVGQGRRTVGVMYDVHPAGNVVAAGEAFDADLALVDPRTMQDLNRVPLPSDIGIAYHLGGVRFDPTGGRLLVSSRFGRSDLWDTTTWTRVEDPDLSQYDIASGYWNDDGSLVATASSGGEVTIRNGVTFEPIRRLIGAARPVGPYRTGPMVFSDDSAYLLTDHDNVIRLWHVATGEQIGAGITTLEGTVSGINGGSGFHAVTADEGHALIWNLDIQEWPQLACHVAGSNLTRSEWEQWGPDDEEFRVVCDQFPVDD